LLGDPCAGGLGGDTSEVDSSGVQLDEEQVIEPLQEHDVHGEEVAGHDAGCLPDQGRRQRNPSIPERSPARWWPAARRTGARRAMPGIDQSARPPWRQPGPKLTNLTTP
jgi:hypothetical protein